MKKLLLLLSVVLTIAGCKKGDGTDKNSVQLENHIANVWIFPEVSSYDRLEFRTDGSYELLERRIGYVSNSYTGEYKVDVNANVVELSGVGRINVKSITSNSLYVVLVKEEGATEDEVTLTLKDPEKLLPNKEEHLVKILDLENVFYPENIADILYSGDKLYRYTKYYSNNDLLFAHKPSVRSLKSVSKPNVINEYSNFVYSDSKITFTEMYCDKSIETVKYRYVYADYVVQLDDKGRAMNISYKSEGNEAIVKLGYTTDGYLEKIVLYEDVFNIALVYDEGNLIELKIFIDGENMSINFSDFTMENKKSFRLPIYNVLGDMEDVMNELNVLGKLSKMLPNASTLKLDEEVVTLKYIYDINNYGAVAKFNAKLSYSDDGTIHTEDVLNLEYQYK